MHLARKPVAALAIGLVLTLAACGGSAAPSSSAPASKAPAASSAPASSAKPSAATSASSSGGPATLQVAFSEIYEGQLPIWVTQDAGIFQQHGLDVHLTYIASAQSITAVVAGQIQIAQGGGSEALSAAVGGADLTLIGNVVPVYPYVFEVAPGIKTVNDLKGKKVGVSRIGSASDIATRIALQKEGLTPDKDFTVVTVGSSTNRTAALKSGAIQGGLEQPPSSFQIETLGLHPLFDMSSLNLPTVNNGIVANRTWVAGHKDLVQKYIDSIVQGIAKTKADKAFAAKTLMKYMKLDNQQFADKTVDYAVAHLYASVPITKPADFSDAVKVLSEKNPKVKDFDVNKLIDNSFVQNAADRGLAK
ncbi:MAG: ABC transporter substrate-binding protein [Chloroflexota bacterium]|nr:ABC transporter substrate-binding protein [Chloroflexota bacterium]